MSSNCLLSLGGWKFSYRIASFVLSTPPSVDRANEGRRPQIGNSRRRISSRRLRRKIWRRMPKHNEGACPGLINVDALSLPLTRHRIVSPPVDVRLWSVIDRRSVIAILGGAPPPKRAVNYDVTGGWSTGVPPIGRSRSRRRLRRPLDGRFMIVGIKQRPRTSFSFVRCSYIRPCSTADRGDCGAANAAIDGGSSQTTRCWWKPNETIIGEMM